MKDANISAEMEKLALLVIELGLYDKDIAFLLDITRSYMSLIKGGRRPCDPLLIKIIALYSFLEETNPDISAKYNEDSIEAKFRKREMLKVLKKDFIQYLENFDVTVETINDSKIN